MNIFKVLSSNDGSINEPNVSSFLAYLLDPNENQGLGSKCVEALLAPLILAPVNKKKYSKLIFNDRVRDLSKNSNYEVRVQAEVKVVSSADGAKRKTRDIDILIELFNIDAEGPIQSLPEFSFCIENKIRDGAIIRGDNQLYEEIIGLKNSYANPKGIQTSIAFIFLTPTKSDRANAEFNDLLDKLTEAKYEIPNYHMVWEESDEAFSIVSLLTNLLDQEAIGRIDPIYDYTKHTIKSFIAFIYSGFRSYQEEKVLSREKNDYGKPVIQYIKDFYDHITIDQDIEKDALKKWVENRVKTASGKTLKNANFDGSYIVNDRNRKHYGVNSPLKDDKNLFFYPDEENKKIIRKLDMDNLPAGIRIYWKDAEREDNIGSALLTEVLN